MIKQTEETKTEETKTAFVKTVEPKVLPKASSIKPGPQIYIGPNLPGGSLAAFTIFKNGLPPYVEELKTDTPALGRLIVPVSKLPEARRRLKQHGVEAKAFRTVADKFNA